MEYVEKRQKNWIGHILKEEGLSKYVLEGMCEGKKEKEGRC